MELKAAHYKLSKYINFLKLLLDIIFMSIINTSLNNNINITLSILQSEVDYYNYLN